MTSSEKPIFPVVVSTVIGCLVILLVVHPKIKTLMLPSSIIVSNTLSAAKRWELNDQYHFGYRLPTATTFGEGPWMTDYAFLKNESFPQVSLLQSDRHYSVDLIVDNLVEAQKLVGLLNQVPHDQKTYSIVTLHSPDEAMHANGYYFEDRSVHNKYWINISHYRL